MLLNLHFETRFGVLSSFRNFVITICYNLHILIFWVLIVISKFQSQWGIKTNVFFGKQIIPRLSARKTQQNRGAHMEKLKMLKSDEPYRPPTLLLCVYGAGLLWFPVLHTLHFQFKLALGGFSHKCGFPPFARSPGFFLVRTFSGGGHTPQGLGVGKGGKCRHHCDRRGSGLGEFILFFCKGFWMVRQFLG